MNQQRKTTSIFDYYCRCEYKVFLDKNKYNHLVQKMFLVEMKVSFIRIKNQINRENVQIAVLCYGGTIVVS